VIAVLCAILGLFLVLRKMSFDRGRVVSCQLRRRCPGVAQQTCLRSTWRSAGGVGLICHPQVDGEGPSVWDAAIGIVSALGIAAALSWPVFPGLQRGLVSYLFGSILSIGNEELVLAVALSAVVLVVVAVFYNDLLAVTFDEEYAGSADKDGAG